MTRRRRLALLIGLAGVTLLLAPLLGARVISPAMIFSSDGPGTAFEIFWQIRVPRVIMGFMAGSALAASGLAFQALFRNPLATPFTLGVSSGASLGAAAYIWLGLMGSFSGPYGLSLFALSGAALSIALVYGLTRVRRRLSTATMLLAGVAMSFCFSSVILFLQYTADFASSFGIVRWLMGGLEVVGYEAVLLVAPLAVGGILIVLCMSSELDLLTAGEDLAASRGVDVRRARGVIFFAASLMVGGVVARCGPIGFVGMMAPHICRLLIGWEHRSLAPATIAFGGAFLVICDTAARTIIAPVEIPVGVITAMLGGPFFLWLLVSRPAESFCESGGR